MVVAKDVAVLVVAIILAIAGIVSVARYLDNKREN